MELLGYSFVSVKMTFVNGNRQIWRSAVGSPQCNPCLPSFVLGTCPSFRYGKTEIFWAAAMTKSESLTNPQMPVV